MKLRLQTIHTVLVLFVFFVFAQNNPDIQTEKSPPKNVLLVRGDSYLETAVGRILIDSLARKGFTVKTIGQKSLNSENSGGYRVIIIFNALKSAGLTAPVKKLIDATSKAQSNVLISTVYGEPWDKNKQSADAVATATKTLNPEILAVKLLTYVNSIVEKDMGPVLPDSVK